jgi:hypothetical protein
MAANFDHEADDEEGEEVNEEQEEAEEQEGGEGGEEKEEEEDEEKEEEEKEEEKKEEEEEAGQRQVNHRHNVIPPLVSPAGEVSTHGGDLLFPVLSPGPSPADIVRHIARNREPISEVAPSPLPNIQRQIAFEEEDFDAFVEYWGREAK